MLAEHELNERLGQEELEQIRSCNLAMRKQILGAETKSAQAKNKAKQAYHDDTEDIQRQFLEQDRMQ